MSNIPSSAIPHAWVRDDDEKDRAAARRSGSPSLAALAGIGAVLVYLVYRVVR